MWLGIFGVVAVSGRERRGGESGEVVSVCQSFKLLVGEGVEVVGPDSSSMPCENHSPCHWQLGQHEIPAAAFQIMFVALHSAKKFRGAFEQNISSDFAPRYRGWGPARERYSVENPYGFYPITNHTEVSLLDINFPSVPSTIVRPSCQRARKVAVL